MDGEGRKMEVYVVTAYRFGDRESHSYVVGSFSSLEKAGCAALEERDIRGGKYSCEIVIADIDEKYDVLDGPVVVKKAENTA